MAFTIATASNHHGIPDTLIFGRAEAMKPLRHKIERVAGTTVPVLIRGESGSGKEVIAGLIHRWSERRNQPFVKINCPAIPETLLESELFGYERGAFTGAYDAKPGLVEVATGGTLFLDEIAELETGVQAKLLHLLQDGAYSRIGGHENKRADIRVVCATNRPIEHEIEAGRFRQDLFYRINVVTIELPPLRDRRADIPGLAEYFVTRYNQEYGRKVAPLSPEVLQLLVRHPWPGNIRELENLAKRYVILESEEAVTSNLRHLSGRGTAVKPNGDTDLSLKSLTRQAVRDLERRIILDVLQANNWNRKETAKVLKISYRALFYKIKQAGVPQKRTVHTPGGPTDGSPTEQA